MVDTVERAVIFLQTETGDSKQQLDALKKSTDAVVESTAKLATTNEKANATRRASNDEVQRTFARLDPLTKAQQQYQNTIAQADRWARQNIGTEEERGRLIDLASERLNRQTAALQTFRGNLDKVTTGTGLARHELVNFSRQIQDVGVSLASGQSPMMVLIQQGTQIADIFASSRSTLGGFFSQAVAGAGRFATSAAGLAAAVAGIGAGALAAASSWSQSQRDIQRALLGIGAASGVTVDEINKIAAGAASATKLSTSEAQEAASAFAATGRIYHDNIQSATAITYDFAKAMGVSTADAAKTLAAALADPVRGLAELEKQYGVVDGRVKGYIRTLMQQNREQEAQNLLLETFGPKIAEAAKLTSIWARAWDTVSKAASDAYAAVGRALSPASDQDKLAALQARLAEQQSGGGRRGINPGRVMAQEMRGGDTEAIEATKRAIDALTASIQKAAEAAADQRFAQFARAADDAVRSTIPQIDQINNLKDKLADLARAQADARIAGKMELGGQATAATAAIQLQLRMTVEAQQAEERRVGAVTRLADAHKNVSVEVAKQVKGLEDQITVAKARAGADTLAAQERATYNRLLLEGKTIEEASLVASKERALAVAQANKAVDDQIVSLRQGVEMERARLEGTEAATAAAQAFENAMRAGADATKAAALAAATLAAEEEKAQIAAEKFAQTHQSIDVTGGGGGGGGGGGSTMGKGIGAGVILPGGIGLSARTIGAMGQYLGSVFFKGIADEEKRRADAEAALFERFSPEGLKRAAEEQKQAAEALQQAAKDQQEAAAAAAEAARQAGNERFKNIAAQYLIQGMNPLAINAMIESGQIQRYDASSTFQTQLDLYKRAGVSSARTRQDILGGIIGEGVAPTELLAALDGLTDAVTSNTDAQIGLSDFYTQQGDRLLGYRGYRVNTNPFAGSGTTTQQGTPTTTPTGGDPYGGVVNTGQYGTGAGQTGYATYDPKTGQITYTTYNAFTGQQVGGTTTGGTPTQQTYTSPYGTGGYLTQRAEGGVAYGPQFTLAGEAGPEAFIPLRGGSVPVQLRLPPGAAKAAAGSNAAERMVINITAPLVNFLAQPTKDEVRETAFQAGQMLRRLMAAGSG